jgi:hypothetical protein
LHEVLTGLGSAAGTASSDPISGTDPFPGLPGSNATGSEPGWAEATWPSLGPGRAASALSPSDPRRAAPDIAGFKVHAGSIRPAAGALTALSAVAGVEAYGRVRSDPPPGRAFDRGENGPTAAAPWDHPQGGTATSGGPGSQGPAIDLTKTNDLLQQLLDEVRRGRQPFLPLGDRNSAFPTS